MEDPPINQPGPELQTRPETQENPNAQAPQELPDRPEYLFANKTKVTQQMARVLVGNRYRRAKAFWVVSALALVVFVALGISEVRQSNGEQGAFYFMIPIVFFAVTGLRKMRGERTVYETFRRLYPEGVIPYGFSEEGIGRGNYMPYAMLTDYDERPEGWILYIEGTSMFVARDGFFKGTPEDFGPFLAKKFAESRAPREEQPLPSS